MGKEIYGYSERGVLTTLFYEMYYNKEPNSIIKEFLEKITFPNENGFNVASGIKDIKIFIEQSFSDFGDADAVMLIENNEKKKITLFFEAKVKTYSTKSWGIKREYNKFLDGIKKKKVSSSNLFTQFFHKIKLVEVLKGNDKDGLDIVVEFPESSTKKERKIGKNPVINTTMIKMLREYIEDCYYIALLPEDDNNIKDFFENGFETVLADDEKYRKMYHSKFGFISWKTISDFAEKSELHDLKRVFIFNRNQIY